MTATPVNVVPAEGACTSDPAGALPLSDLICHGHGDIE
jgi:hypothetical protein